MKKIGSLKILLTSTVVLGLLSACGAAPKIIGAGDDALSDEFYYPGRSTAKSDLWVEMADYLGISSLQLENDEDATIAAALGATPGVLAAAVAASPEALKAKYGPIATELQASVAGRLLGDANTTQCAAIDGMVKVSSSKFLVDGVATDVPGAELFVVRYRLKNAAGEAEETPRFALLNVPAGERKALILYAHASTLGLNYSEMVGLFGILQAEFVIAAPTFPGEALKISDDAIIAAQTQQTGATMFDADVREYMGLHSCIFDLITGSVANLKKLGTDDWLPTETVIDNPLKTIPAFLGDNTINNGKISARFFNFPDRDTPVPVPYTLLVGSDRGGQVAMLAAARAGFYLKAAADPDLPLPTGFVQPMFPSAVTTLGTHQTFMMGSNLLQLQALVQGTIGNTAFSQIPGSAFVKMADIFNEADSSVPLITNPKLAALEIAIRDAVYMAQFIPPALRNWSAREAAPTERRQGQIANFHGTENRLVDFTQAQISYGTLTAVAAGVTAFNDANPGKAIPGFDHVLYAFQPAESFFTAAPCTNARGRTETKRPCFNDSTTDFNHFFNPSFLDGKLASASDSNKALITSMTAIATDAIYDSMISTLENTLVQQGKATAGEEAYKAALGLFRTQFVPMTTKASPDEPFAGGYTNPDTLFAVTPPGIIAAWSTYHAARAGLAVTGVNDLP